MLSDSKRINRRLAYTAPKAPGNHCKSALNSNSSRKHQREAQSPLMRYIPAIVVLSPFQFVSTELTRGQSRINSRLVSTAQSYLLSKRVVICSMLSSNRPINRRLAYTAPKAKAISIPIRLESTDARLKVLLCDIRPQSLSSLHSNLYRQH
jgi:hypothetical protein